MLYPPSDWFWQWDLDDHEQIMSIAVAFCWHILLIFCGLIVQLWVVRGFVIRKNRFNCDELFYLDNLEEDYKYEPDSNGKIDSSETRFLALNSEDEEDEENNEKIIFNK